MEPAFKTVRNILVCVKAVPSSSSVQVDGEYRLQRDNVNLQWNIADEAALEAALSLKGTDGTVTVLTMGPPKLEEPLKELLARGADRAVLITDRLMAGADTHATAAALKAAAESLGPFELILCGRRAIDGETGQVPGELAAALDIPCISNVEEIHPEKEQLILSRRLENGVQHLCAEGPLVVSMCEYSYTLRLAGIQSMRRARNKAVERYSAADLGMTAGECGLKGSLTKVVAMEATFPGLRKGVKEWSVPKGVAYMLNAIREVQP